MPQVFSIRSWLVLLLSVLAVLALAACGDSTPTASPAGPGATLATVTPTPEKPVPTATALVSGSPATPVSLPTVTPSPASPLTTTAAATTAIATTAAATTAIATTVPATTIISVPKTPTLKLSETTAQVGGQVTINGSGFSANTRLKIDGGYQGPAVTLATLITDEKGQFSKFIKLDKMPDGTAYRAGQFTFVVTSSANGTARKISLTIEEPNTAHLAVSRPSVKFGEELVVTGSAFPANTKLKLWGGVQNPAEDYGPATTDAQGKFSIKVKIAKVEGLNYPEPYHFTAILGDEQLMGYASVTVTDGSENNLYLVLRVLENQGPESKVVIVEDVSGNGKTYLIDFATRPELTLEDGSTGTFESLKPGNIMEFKGAEVPASQRGDVPVIKPLAVRVTQ